MKLCFEELIINIESKIQLFMPLGGRRAYEN